MVPEETVRTASRSREGPGPVTSCGWFHAKMPTPQGEAIVLNKNGGVAGFTSWMGFTSWQGTGAPSADGAFVLTNSHGGTRMGIDAMKLLLREIGRAHV